MYSMLCKDILEIALLSTFFYHVICWLLQDRVNNLIYYFAGYALVVAAAFMLPLPILQILLLWYSPVIMILFVILHEKQLQKNFVATYKSTYKLTQQVFDWPNILIQTGLHNFIEQQSTLYLIEQDQPLDSLVSTPFIINSPVQKELLEMICASQSYNQMRALWITKHGMLRGINTYWHQNTTTLSDLTYADEDTLIESLEPLIENCSAIACFSNAITREWTIVARDCIFKKISAQHALQLLQKLLVYSSTSARSAYYAEHKNVSHQRHTR